MENNLPLDLTQDSFEKYEQKGGRKTNLKGIKTYLGARRILLLISLLSTLYFLMFVNIDDIQGPN